MSELALENTGPGGGCKNGRCNLTHPPCNPNSARRQSDRIHAKTAKGTKAKSGDLCDPSRNYGDKRSQELSESLNLAAFNLNNNEYSSVQLKEKNFGEIFNSYNKEDTDKNPSTMNKEEWMAAQKRLAVELNEATKTDPKKRIEPAELSKKDEKKLEKLFKTIAGKDKTISQEDFTNFYQDLFAKHENTKNDPVKGVELTKFMKDYKKH